MVPSLEFGSHRVSSEEAPLVIAEIGINHGGSIQVAKTMVDAARRAGIQVVKHQTHIPDDEMSSAAKKVIPGNASVSIYDVISSCALNESDEYELKSYVEACGMTFLSTPFSRAAADRLEEFGVQAFKIGSGELNNYPLIKHIASFGKPMILSTGMNDIESIRVSVEILTEARVQFALMHTTNLYPTPPRLVRLGAMTDMHLAFPEAPFGLSDHTTNNNACLAATALGASLLERHFTDRMDRVGPDISNSMDENAARELVQGSREIFAMRGGLKEAAPEEQVTIDFAFASVVSISDIKAGETLTRDNIWVKRPGTGDFPADKYESLLGQKAALDIPIDTMLRVDMVHE